MAVAGASMKRRPPPLQLASQDEQPARSSNLLGIPGQQLSPVNILEQQQRKLSALHKALPGQLAPVPWAHLQDSVGNIRRTSSIHFSKPFTVPSAWGDLRKPSTFPSFEIKEEDEEEEEEGEREGSKEPTSPTVMPSITSPSIYAHSEGQSPRPERREFPNALPSPSPTPSPKVDEEFGAFRFSVHHDPEPAEAPIFNRKWSGFQSLPHSPPTSDDHNSEASPPQVKITGARDFDFESSPDIPYMPFRVKAGSIAHPWTAKPRPSMFVPRSAPLAEDEEEQDGADPSRSTSRNSSLPYSDFLDSYAEDYGESGEPTADQSSPNWAKQPVNWAPVAAPTVNPEDNPAEFIKRRRSSIYFNQFADRRKSSLIRDDRLDGSRQRQSSHIRRNDSTSSSRRPNSVHSTGGTVESPPRRKSSIYRGDGPIRIMPRRKSSLYSVDSNRLSMHSMGRRKSSMFPVIADDEDSWEHAPGFEPPDEEHLNLLVDQYRDLVDPYASSEYFGGEEEDDEETEQEGKMVPAPLFFKPSFSGRSSPASPRRVPSSARNGDRGSLLSVKSADGLRISLAPRRRSSLMYSKDMSSRGSRLSVISPLSATMDPLPEVPVPGRQSSNPTPKRDIPGGLRSSEQCDILPTSKPSTNPALPDPASSRSQSAPQIPNPPAVQDPRPPSSVKGASPPLLSNATYATSNMATYNDVSQSDFRRCSEDESPTSTPAPPVHQPRDSGSPRSISAKPFQYESEEGSPHSAPVASFRHMSEEQSPMSRPVESSLKLDDEIPPEQLPASSYRQLSEDASPMSKPVSTFQTFDNRESPESRHASQSRRSSEYESPMSHAVSTFRKLSEEESPKSRSVPTFPRASFDKPLPPVPGVPKQSSVAAAPDKASKFRQLSEDASPMSKPVPDYDNSMPPLPNPMSLDKVRRRSSYDSPKATHAAKFRRTSSTESPGTSSTMKFENHRAFITQHSMPSPNGRRKSSETSPKTTSVATFSANPAPNGSAPPYRPQSPSQSQQSASSQPATKSKAKEVNFGNPTFAPDYRPTSPPIQSNINPALRHDNMQAANKAAGPTFRSQTPPLLSQPYPNPPYRNMELNGTPSYNKAMYRPESPHAPVSQRISPFQQQHDSRAATAMDYAPNYRPGSPQSLMSSSTTFSNQSVSKQSPHRSAMNMFRHQSPQPPMSQSSSMIRQTSVSRQSPHRAAASRARTESPQSQTSHSSFSFRRLSVSKQSPHRGTPNKLYPDRSRSPPVSKPGAPLHHQNGSKRSPHRGTPNRLYTDRSRSPPVSNASSTFRRQSKSKQSPHRPPPLQLYPETPISPPIPMPPKSAFRSVRGSKDRHISFGPIPDSEISPTTVMHPAPYHGSSNHGELPNAMSKSKESPKSLVSTLRRFSKEHILPTTPGPSGSRTKPSQKATNPALPTAGQKNLAAFAKLELDSNESPYSTRPHTSAGPPSSRLSEKPPPKFTPAQNNTQSRPSSAPAEPFKPDPRYSQAPQPLYPAGPSNILGGGRAAPPAGGRGQRQASVWPSFLPPKQHNGVFATASPFGPQTTMLTKPTDTSLPYPINGPVALYPAREPSPLPAPGGKDKDRKSGHSHRLPSLFSSRNKDKNKDKEKEKEKEKGREKSSMSDIRSKIRLVGTIDPRQVETKELIDLPIAAERFAAERLKMTNKVDGSKASSIRSGTESERGFSDVGSYRDTQRDRERGRQLERQREVERARSKGKGKAVQNPSQAPVQDQRQRPVQDPRLGPMQNQRPTPMQDQRLRPVHDQRPRPVQDLRPRAGQDQRPRPPQDSRMRPIHDQRPAQMHDPRTGPVQDQRPRPMQDPRQINMNMKARANGMGSRPNGMSTGWL